MKPATFLCLLFALSLAAPGATGTADAGGSAPGGLRYTITVTKFENEAGWYGQWDIGDAWDTVMTDMLNQTGRFIVLGETDMRYEALAEQDLAASGRTAQGAKTPVTGQLTPAQLLVKGSITHVQGSTTGGGGGVSIKGFRIGGKKDKAEVNATMYLVDSTTGQVLASTSVVGKSDRKGGTIGYSGSNWDGDVGAFKNDNVGKAVEAAIAEGVDWLVKQLPDVPWTGSVAMVQAGKVYVNRGTREGVTPGQTFVVGESTVIRDPDTGEVLDEALEEVARLQVETVKEKVSICTVISGSADAIQTGMAVHLAQ